MDSSGKVIHADFRKPATSPLPVADERVMVLIQQPIPASGREPGKIAFLRATTRKLRSGIADLSHLIRHDISTEGDMRVHWLTFDNGEHVRVDVSDADFTIWNAMVNIVSPFGMPDLSEL
ncbi:hypothetical protein HP532_06520 [Pseudomonas sp. CrR25]|nr:hypothetical protein [Pseudomonas sp. CrR25]